jgi:hypothetical protein
MQNVSTFEINGVPFIAEIGRLTRHANFTFMICDEAFLQQPLKVLVNNIDDVISEIEHYSKMTLEKEVARNIIAELKGDYSTATPLFDGLAEPLNEGTLFAPIQARTTKFAFLGRILLRCFASFIYRDVSSS